MDFSKTSKLTIVFVFVAYVFSVLMRYIWIYKMQGNPNITWNGEFLILSPDGYVYAEGAKDILSGTVQNFNSRVTSSLSILTAFLVKNLPFSFETIIFYMSTFFSSLIVIPVFYITKRFGSNYLAFSAAIFSSIVVSYYKRTMSGYYDTDMLIIVLPMFIYWFLIEALSKKDKIFSALAVLATLAFSQWLASDIALNLSIVIMVLVYTLLFDRKSLFNYFLFILVLVAALPLSIIFKLPILLFVYTILYFNEKLNKKVTIIVLFVVFIAFLVVAAMYNKIIFHLIIQKLSYYFAKGVDINNGLYFADSGSMVMEVGNISYMEFAKRISGNIIIFIFSVVGYILMTLRHKIMIILLPMLMLGFISYGIPGFIPSAGLRFSFYATPVLAISLMYIIIWLSMISKSMFKMKTYLRYILFVLVLLPNVNYVLDYKVKSMIKKHDIEVLNSLKKVVKKNDYVISWWDYGYNLRYYTGVNTVSDGGLQLGMILYPDAALFTETSQELSANLAKILTYEVDKHRGINYVNMMMKTYGFKDSNAFFNALSSNQIKIKENKFDTYIYIPNQMIELYGTLDSFYRINLNTGKPKYEQKYFSMSDSSVNFRNKEIVKINKDILYIKDKQKLYFKSYNNSINIKKIITLAYSEKGKLSTKSEIFHSDGYIMIILASGKVLIVNDIVFNSTLIQLGVMEKYNHKLFEEVDLNAYAKIYKVK
jgi:dolichyl-diphosphooligosaccharide--protein glycosyltransferase/undecaprenyl-diphosphooligosaccharide--protein glycosyltransferase